jgi:hypothetical protein
MNGWLTAILPHHAEQANSTQSKKPDIAAGLSFLVLD